jgi:hypothetical protein
MVQRLSDGQPITFEWLNSLVAEINDLRADLSANTRADAQNRLRPITYAGDAINTAGKIKVIADQQKIGDARKSKAAFNAYVDFPGNGFKDASVIVVATSDMRKNKTSAEKLVVSVANVTKNGFTCTVTPIDGETLTVGQDVIINYIAVGDAP